MRKMMTISEIAETLSVTERTVYQWANSGEIPAYKVGNSWRFKADEIEAWLEGRSNRSSEQHRPAHTRADASGNEGMPFHERVRLCGERIVGFLMASDEKGWVVEKLAQRLGENIEVVREAVRQAVEDQRCVISKPSVGGVQSEIVKLKRGT